ncbi:MAG: BMP family ABC transporter substrate-binding protein [Lachnospiraceae bacterium]|nr:BMP family ABC transporter substrate-binding protein [Lachnospiraceae bacterium]
MIDDYLRAKRLGDRCFRKDTARGVYPYLPALDEIVSLQDVSEEHVGLIEIPTDKIVGTKTKGRTESFARNFMPILAQNSEFATKWIRLYDSAVTEGIREPIKVYEYMRQFYVQEGNKRVSMSNFLEIEAVLGDVTRLVPNKTEDIENKIYFEFLDFYRVAPYYDIAFSHEGDYGKLAYYYGEDLKNEWPREKLENLRSNYITFRKVFKKEGGDRLDMTTGDAFLVYLRFYGPKDLIGMEESLLKSRIQKLWDEFRVSGKEEVTLALHPSEVEKDNNGLFSLWAKKPEFSSKKPLKVAFMYERPAETSQWIYGHELGRNYIEQIFGPEVETICYNDCAYNELLRWRIDQAVEAGAQIVFTVSPIQMEETLKSALHYPNVKFLNCSVNLTQSSVRTYYGRMYEAKFLMGFLAGTRNIGHRIGYLAAYPIYGAVAEINAFALGASMADPESEIYLAWSSEKDKDWRSYFKEMQVDLISGADLIRPEKATREYGLYREENGEIKNLAFPIWDWGKYYELIIRQVLDGTWDNDPVGEGKALNYWWGMSSGVIDVILSPHLPYQTYKLADILKQSMVTEQLNPFYGEIYEQGHKKIKGYGTPTLSNEEILTQTWLAENVIGSLPQIESLNRKAKEAVNVSGVIEE